MVFKLRPDRAGRRWLGGAQGRVFGAVEQP